MNSSNPRGNRLAVLVLLCVGLSACAACGPGALPGEDEGTGGAGLKSRDAGMLSCAPGEVCDEYPGGSGPTFPAHPDINGGFESISTSGIPSKWTLSGPSCTWGGLVLVTTNAASSGAQGLRMYGGCSAISIRAPAPTTATRASVSLKSRSVTEGRATASLTWFDANGAEMSGDSIVIQGTAERMFVSNYLSVVRPAGADSATVTITTPSGATVTMDFDEVSLDFAS